jgi:hypothetical protein
MGWFAERKRLKLLRKQRADALWIWIGNINLSRNAPRQMIGSQNLAKMPEWMLSEIYTLTDPEREVIYKFKNDKDYEYKFKPVPPLFPSFHCDIYKRVRHWRKIVRKLEKATKQNS